MKVALISDIHGNLVSLQAVLADIALVAPDRIVCLGDVALDGPQPREVIQQLQALDCAMVNGNCEDILVRAASGDVDEGDEHGAVLARWGVDQVGSDGIAYLRSFSPRVRVKLGDGVDILCFHGSPRSNQEPILPATSEAEIDAMVESYSATVLAYGHIHRPVVRPHRNGLLVCVGSVGAPFDPASPPEQMLHPPYAEYTVIGWQDGRLSTEFRRVPIDVQAVRDAARVHDLPHPELWTEGWGDAAR
jgi:putative phosphoesterase